MGMLDNIDAALFDMDGTLIDSMWMWRQIDIDYLGQFGIELPDDLQKTIEGWSFDETARYFQKRFGITDDVNVIKAEWNAMAYDFYLNEVQLKPGAIEFLKELRKRGIRCGIATSNSKELVAAVLKNLNVREYFEEIHTACEVEHGKPFPDIYLLVAEKLGADPSRCLVFEDILPGIEAGKAAGMKVCAVYDEYSQNELAVKIARSDYYFRGFDEMLEHPEVLWAK